MKVAVTGATGFIGRHVVAELQRRSISAVLVCRPSTELPGEFSLHDVVRLDISDAGDTAFELLGKPDMLVHLAWGGLPNYKSHHHFESELTVQYRFLKSCIESGLKRLLVTGTCFEYGMQSGPLQENAATCPGNPYGFAKDALRRQLEFLQRAKPFHMTWARLFYLYGEGQAESSLFSQLRRASQRGDKEFSMSGGEQLRDYLPVTDVAQHLVSLATASENHGIVNICSGKPISVRTLAEGWVKEHNWPIQLRFGHYPYPDYEPMAFWGDRSKLNRYID